MYDSSSRPTTTCIIYQFFFYMSICKQNFFLIVHWTEMHSFLTTESYLFTPVNLRIPVAFWQVQSEYDAVLFCVLHHCAIGSHTCQWLPGSMKKFRESALSWFYYKRSHSCPRMTFCCMSDYNIMNQIYFFAEKFTLCKELNVKGYNRWNQNYFIWMWIIYLWKEHFISF
jgi:hypothetical protein